MDGKEKVMSQLRILDPDFRFDEKDLEIYTMEDLVNREFPERQYVMSPWLPEQGIVMIHAKTGIGKTYFTLTASLAIALGKSFAIWDAPVPRKLLYVDGEMSGIEIQNRAKNLLCTFGEYDPVLLRNFYIITPQLMLKTLPDLSQDAGQAYVIDYVKRLGIDVVVLDNVSCLMPSVKENDADSWGSVQTWELQLRKMGTSVIRVQHSGKGGSHSHRGSSKHEDIVDTTIFLEKPEDYLPQDGARFIVHFEKHRGFYGNEASSYELKLINDIKLGTYWESTSQETCIETKILRAFKDGLSYKEMSFEHEIKIHTISRIIKKAFEQNLLTKADLIAYKNVHRNFRGG